MDATTAITSMNDTTHMLMTWTLVGLLLAWMIVFACLALRRGAKQVEHAPMPSTTITPTPVSVAPKKLHVIAVQPVTPRPAYQAREQKIAHTQAVLFEHTSAVR
ncbi:hypothetical protein KSD_35020 [Ktedonobacter sp. SOSP1-85]|uniref:Uncharacterized protein n=1 Tax=Ktedonobacter robiniae TaxID=2778365 RepID=A0ABQ3UJ04_9CHLR|nr:MULTISPECIES: hypothetical protein [Ktedonobacter]GHO52693.1 hypothetical protein KSB_11680 [Ktedonobacter robiniae]GHO66273.1 hypothetical protein KSC_051650 [Ktedonobacter sp. SOSP1-52]GHO75731.1 hypothetical protein KSD_35020 [Ktedonobacter sp. SOSP1-85]